METGRPRFLGGTWESSKYRPLGWVVSLTPNFLWACFALLQTGPGRSSNRSDWEPRFASTDLVPAKPPLGS